MNQVKIIVIGAGIVGLACARAAAIRGHEVLVLERELSFGTQTSSRHSEVIHAGLYYPTGSLKARLCVDGKNRLYQYCRERSINHRAIGKLIVAQDDNQHTTLEAYQKQGHENGVLDLKILSQTELKTKEPSIKGISALWSPSTGIFDSHDVMLNYVGDIENHGGLIAYNSPVKHIENNKNEFILHIDDKENTTIKAHYLINAAGLNACETAASISDLDKHHIPKFYYAKGNYFSYHGKTPFTHLIYPVPEPGGLGIHATLDLSGQVRFGPDVEWIDTIDYTTSQNRLPMFEARIRQYYPQLPAGALSPAYTGIRPKITGPNETGADFMISMPNHHKIEGLVNLFGIESPGATSSLAIGEYTADNLNL